ncbi:hypothetical protein [Priestia endophytica]|uniref:Uncharacterized protein n=1 Tax=Priestia endophytica TaxID=135735 RepID=A0AAX1Q636_9BACI|nr:hypothetical protein [Priestia endophytica]RAS75191.1 hypothetical protein A3864_16100 [Priestia endophytica]RAS85549.1 hypothetical protein A3863_21770 [Priestia endophytica]
MGYKALVKNFNPHIEGEITVEINSVEITGFMPFSVSFEPKKRHTVSTHSLSLIILDDLDIQEDESLEYGFFNIEESFAYNIKGIVDCEKKTINVGFELGLEDEIVNEMWQYNHKRV